MIESATAISHDEQSFPTALVTFSSEKTFEEVVRDFEKQLGRLDQEKIAAAKNSITAIAAMEGESGLMIVTEINMDQIIPALINSSTRARQYLIGNPLFGSKMSAFSTLFALYAPFRILIYTQDGKTCISYDKPSTLLGRLGYEEISVIAKNVDNKIETLARKSLVVASP